MKRTLSLSLLALVALTLTVAASAQLTVRNLQPLPVDPEPPWPNYAPITWVDEDDPSLALTLDAKLVSSTPTQQNWVASAVSTSDGTLVVDLTVQTDYTASGTTYTAVATRYRNSWGFPPFGPQSFTATFTTNLNDDGSIAYDGPGVYTWFAAYLGANSLSPGSAGLTTFPARDITTDDPQAEPGGPVEVPNEEEEWTSNGCSGPCSDHWKDCCDPHDECYCKGGDATARLNCDNDFKECLRGMGMGKIKAGLYHKGVRLFGAKYFNCNDPQGC
jgi:hypothetical protein